jgi:hypothetical protein
MFWLNLPVYASFFDARVKILMHLQGSVNLESLAQLFVSLTSGRDKFLQCDIFYILLNSKANKVLYSPFRLCISLFDYSFFCSHLQSDNHTHIINYAVPFSLWLHRNRELFWILPCKIHYVKIQRENLFRDTEVWLMFLYCWNRERNGSFLTMMCKCEYMKIM